MSNHFLGEKDSKIHLIEGPPLLGSPILHIPGMFGVAEDCIAEMMALAHRKSFAMSLRGRGASDPCSGYSIEDHVSDIVLAVEYIGEPLTICSHSISNIFAVGAAYVRPDLVRSLCLIDYGLELKLTDKWLQKCLKNRSGDISESIINSIFTDLKGSVWNLLKQLNIPVTYCQGFKKGNQTKSTDISQFKSNASHFRIVKLPDSQHWPHAGDDYNSFMQTLDKVSRV